MVTNKTKLSKIWADNLATIKNDLRKKGQTRQMEQCGRN